MGFEKARENEPLHGSRIEDYAYIGDLESGALISREGSIDWLCWPTFSSPACFAALLGTREHGFWKIAPAADGEIGSERRYDGNTLILETTFRVSTGVVRMTDFMPPRVDHSYVLRSVEGLEGEVAMAMELAIRFDYGRTIPWVTQEDHSLRAIAGPQMAMLRTSVPLVPEGMSTRSDFRVAKGQKVTFCLSTSSSLEEAAPELDVDRALGETRSFWQEWMSQSTYRGAHREMVERSLVTLKALTYRPSGGIVAAATAGLPECIGGPRNWDYRFCWLRDTAFTLLILLRAGFQEEAVAWRRWLLRSIAGTPHQLQTIYGLSGERQMTEWEANWLPGYENSTPVRFGNAAVDQFQLDVFGEVASALYRAPEAEDDIRVDVSALQAGLIDHLCHVWDRPDAGIWEVRGGQRHFVHSKVMAWVALDRAIKRAATMGGEGDVERWKKNRSMIHAEVCERGFSKRRNSFVQSYDSEDLDASCLRLVLVGFLPPDDPRIVGTVDAIGRELTVDGLIARYDTKAGSDGLEGGEGMFLACSFWMVSNLHLIGRTAEAEVMFRRLLSLCNDVGLLSEEYDPHAGRMLGNFPQALSHIALVHAAMTLSGEWTPEPWTPQP